MKGNLVIQCLSDAKTQPVYHFKNITFFVVTGNTADISATGTASGKANKGSTFSVNATAVDNSPDSFSATITGPSPSTAVVCQVSGALTHKGDHIVITPGK